jgi:hypothetical protein
VVVLRPTLPARITPGELTNRQPATDPFSATSRPQPQPQPQHQDQLAVYAADYHPSPQLCRDAGARIHDDKRGQIT